MDESKTKRASESALTVAVFCPSLSGGGAERVSAELSLELQRHFKKLYYFALYTDNQSFEYGGELVDFGFGKIRKKYASNAMIFKARVFLEYFRLPFLMRKKRRELGIACTISFLNMPGVLNILSRAGDKTIVSVRISHNYHAGFFRDIRNDGFFGAIINFLVKRLFARADHIVAVSETVREELMTVSKVKESAVSVIYNQVRTLEIRRLAASPLEGAAAGFFRTHKVVINVGRLEPQKNQKRLIRVFRELSDMDPELGLCIVGDGSMKKELEDYVAELGLGQKVFMVGYNKNPFQYIAQAWLFLLTSDREGFPNVLLEAVACGVPVAAYDCKSGPKEILTDNARYREGILDHGRGLLLPMDLPDRSAARDIYSYMQDKEVVDAGRKSAETFLEEKCSSSAIVGQWVNLIEGVCKE